LKIVPNVMHTER